MSRPHAFAAVTQVLLHLLNENLSENDVSSLVGGSGPATASPPDRVLDASGALGQPRLNLFLHGITYNPAYRNADLPTRDRQGQIVNSPLLGLDLHYLLTAYGQDDLQAETLMGFAMEALHKNPIPSRRRIQEALAQEAAGLNMTTLEVSELAQQIESIKITPETLSVDDMSKLWTALQTHLRLTSLYAVSVVLIESRLPKRTPLPVLTRGPRVLRRVAKTFEDSPDDNLPQGQRRREEGIVVQPGLVPAVPTLLGFIHDRNQIAVRMGEPVTLEGVQLDGDKVLVLQIAVRMGESITLEGLHLGGDEVLVRFTEPRSRRTLDVPVPPTLASPTRLEVRIPAPEPDPAMPEDEDPAIATNWQAGFYSVAALVRRPVERPETLADEADEEVPEEQAELEERVSNQLPVILAPKFKRRNEGEVEVDEGDLEIDVETFENAEGETEFVFTVGCSPPVRNSQKASLIVGQREIPADPLEAEQSDTLTFRGTGFERGTTQPLRLNVDGVFSIFIDRSKEPPEFIWPTVDIP